MRKSLYMNILVPLDGSEYSQKALLQACDMAKNHQSNLILVYVVDKPLSLNLLDRKEYLKILRSFGQKVLIKAKQTAKLEGLDATTIMKEGNISNEILKLAKSKKCNLIIIGSKGLGKAARFFLGSVSNKLANNSPCSILIVK